MQVSCSFEPDIFIARFQTINELLDKTARHFSIQYYDNL